MEVFNVKDYGAKGDGSSLDDVSLQDAINAACTSKRGGIVHLPAGKYKINQSIIIPGNEKMIVIQGAGMLATEIFVNSATSFTEAVLCCEGGPSNLPLIMRDFTISGSDRAPTGISLRHNNPYSTIERVHVLNCTEQGIWIKWGCYGITLYHCVSNYNDGLGLKMGGGPPDDEIKQVNHVAVFGGDFTTNQAGNLWIERGSDIILSGVNLELIQRWKGDKDHPIWGHALYAEECYGITINSCYFECGTSPCTYVSEGVNLLYFSCCSGVAVNGVAVGLWHENQTVLRAETCSGVALNGFAVDAREYKNDTPGIGVEVGNSRAVSLQGCRFRCFNSSNVPVLKGILVKGRTDVTLSGVSFSDYDPTTHTLKLACEHPISTWTANAADWPSIVVDGIYMVEWQKSRLCSGTRFFRRIFDDMDQA